MFLFFGLGKVQNPAAFVQYLLSDFQNTWLPKWLLVPYGYAIPFIELGIGILLLLGIARNAVLFFTGLFLITLTFGQIVLQKPIVFNNLIYTLAVAALLFLAEYDCWLLPFGNRPRVPEKQPGLG